jgi:NO-binding membrane sensor protein with MHYT domain
MRIAGIIILILGIAGLVFFGIEAMNESESFSVLGAEVAVSTANWTPVIVSAVVMVVGIILLAVRKK